MSTKPGRRIGVLHASVVAVVAIAAGLGVTRAIVDDGTERLPTSDVAVARRALESARLGCGDAVPARMIVRQLRVTEVKPAEGTCMGEPNRTVTVRAFSIFALPIWQYEVRCQSVLCDT